MYIGGNPHIYMYVSERNRSGHSFAKHTFVEKANSGNSM